MSMHIVKRCIHQPALKNIQVIEMGQLVIHTHSLSIVWHMLKRENALTDCWSIRRLLIRLPWCRCDQD